MKKVIETIGKKVLDSIFDVRKNEYDFDGGCYEPWNGICDGPSASTSFCENVFGHYASITADSSGDVEVLFEDDNYPNLDKAVQEYVKNNFDGDEFLSVVCDDVNKRSMDEFQRNGFSSASDYYNYRYGI